jgi:hypothetical protein
MPSLYSTMYAIFANFPKYINNANVKSVYVNTFNKQVHTVLKSLYLNHWNDIRQEHLISKLRTCMQFSRRELYVIR